MNKIFILLVLVFCCNILAGQQKEQAEKWVEEGIADHDKGDFAGAIRKYDQALQLDQDNLLALAEKAMSLLALQQYEESIGLCERALKLHPGAKSLGMVYVTAGNAYDGLKQTDKALEMYERGIIEFPDFYMLHFNKGITLTSMGRIDDAISCFEKSASLNPRHPGSQNALARTLLVKDRRIPALLVFGRFFVIEPQSNRAKENLQMLKDALGENVEQTGKKSVSVNIDASKLPREKTDGQVSANDFSSTDLILTMEAALDYDKKFKKHSEVEKFIRKMNTMCASLGEAKNGNHGFYWSYYVPYYLEMKEKNFIEVFSHIVFATSGDSDVDKWLKENEKDIDAFYAWSRAFVWSTGN
ncbi:MAG: tetratricopeptide repeat protein [Flavobacteriales bacterium]|jgi:tetratricopeptide (TPR) repeat protein